MSVKQFINAATMGEPELLRPMIGWTLLEYFLKGAPVGTTIMLIRELFLPFEDPGSTLNISRIIVLLLMLVVCLWLAYLVSQKSYKEISVIGYQICNQGRLKIAEHLRRLSMGFYNSRDPGDIGAYIVVDYANVEMLLTHLYPKLIGGLILPVIAIMMIFFIDWRLALAMSIVIPLTYPMVILSNKIVTFFGKRLTKAKIEAASRMIEYIQGIRLIKAFNLGGVRFQRMENTFKNLKNESIKIEAGTGPTIIFGSVILNLGTILVMLLGINYLIAGTLPISNYVILLLVSLVIYAPLLEAVVYVVEMQYMGLSAIRIDTLCKTAPLTEGTIQQVSNHDIEFKNVDFMYDGKRSVVNNVSLKIPANSLTAFVGCSGSGKTTLTRLIARFWDVTAGEILIGGHNIKDYPVDTLMSQISIVFQDVYLFKDTILNNIRIGREDASEAEIIAAAQAAHCHDFIMALPDQYNTMVGEGGNTLSGGEKQRISIARAILKDAPIILLDEATASLDPENELYIQQAINQLVKNKTVVIIAHRLGTIAEADNIVVIDKGSIAEQGKYQELMSLNGLFAQMWAEQQRVKGWKF